MVVGLGSNMNGLHIRAGGNPRSAERGFQPAPQRTLAQEEARFQWRIQEFRRIKGYEPDRQERIKMMPNALLIREIAREKTARLAATIVYGVAETLERQRRYAA